MSTFPNSSTAQDTEVLKVPVVSNDCLLLPSLMKLNKTSEIEKVEIVKKMVEIVKQEG